MAFLNIFSRKKEKKEKTLKIIVDNREKNSLVVSELMKKGYGIELRGKLFLILRVQ
jgi:ERCC4-type nuclease